MKFPYLKSARVRLQERKNSCLRASLQTAIKHTAFFLDFVRNDPIIKTIVNELVVTANQKFSDPDQLFDDNMQCMCLPDNRTDCAAYYLRLLEILAPFTSHQYPRFLFYFERGSSSILDMFQEFFGQVLEPLCAYLDERIDDGDLMLYTLSRYQRECTWFEADSVAKLASEADSRKVENVLDNHLRTWLFREGINYPFSAPNAPSGRPDIVVWHGEEPLPIEVKVFDGDGRDLRHVSQGLWQAHRYAVDYGKPFGYLVVFNVSPNLLAFENNTNADGPPCVLVGGLNVFTIVVNVGTDRLSASKEKPIETKLVKTPGADTTLERFGDRGRVQTNPG